MKKYLTVIVICSIFFISICPIYSYAGEEITITSREIVEKLSKLESLFYGLEKRFDSFEKYVEKRIDSFEKYVEKRLDDFKWIFGIVITALFTVLGYIILEIMKLKQNAATKDDIAVIQKGIEALQNNILAQPKLEITEFKKTAEEEIRIVKKDQIRINEKIDQILQYLKLPDLTPSAQLAQ